MPETYDVMQRIMLRAPFYLSKLTIPYMRKSGDGTGVIGNMAHVLTQHGQKGGENPQYQPRYKVQYQGQP